jgi:hypothetical protein
MEQSDRMPPRTGALPGRSCAGCTLCCSLLSVAELDKPPLVTCAHCDAQGGCGIYQHRPTECRQFYCGYRLDPALDARWKPSRCKLVVAFEEHPCAVVIHVDAGAADAWREEPFYSQIKRWARAAARGQGQVVVWQGDTKIVIAPDRHHDAAAAACP